MTTQGAIKARLIMNPRSGLGGVDLSGPLSILREQGWDVSVRQKLHGGHATELAREAAREGFHVVVDCGGDGTLNELVEGVLGTETAVGVLPGGTANVWAHEVGVASQLQMAALQLVNAERRRVDVGQVTVNGKHKSHFVLMAGVGLDGAIIERVNKPLKNRIGLPAIGLAALQALPSAKAVPVRIELDDLRWQGRILEVIVGNTRRYGGFINITADAYVDDGLFDVCLITVSGPIGVGRLAGSLMLNRQPNANVAQFYRVAHLRIVSPVTLPLQVDGGSVKLQDEAPTAEGTVYEFSMLARGVTMLVPKTYNGALFQPANLATVSVNAALQPVPTHGVNGANGNKHGDKGDEGKESQMAKNGKNGKSGKSGKSGKNGKGRKGEKQRLVTVLEVGVDSLIVARIKNGRVARVRIDQNTLLDDGSGEQRPLLSALSLITAGDSLLVTGRKDDGGGTVLATRVAFSAHSGSPIQAKGG